MVWGCGTHADEHRGILGLADLRARCRRDARMVQPLVANTGELAVNDDILRICYRDAVLAVHVKHAWIPPCNHYRVGVGVSGQLGAICQHVAQIFWRRYAGTGAYWSGAAIRFVVCDVL